MPSRSALAYVRSPGADGDHAADGQRDAIQAYAGFRGLRVVEAFVDDGVPGGVPLAARPAGGRLVDRLRGPDARDLAVVVTRLELLFSSAAECVAYEREWRERGVEIHVLDLAGNPVSTGTLEGRFMIGVLDVARQMEEQPARDRRHAPPVHDRPRLGERVVKGYVVPDPDELRAVRRIQELAAAGKSLRLIAQALDEEGVPTKRRAAAWSKEAIRLILRRIEDGQIPDLARPDASPDGTPA